MMMSLFKTDVLKLMFSILNLNSKVCRPRRHLTSIQRCLDVNNVVWTLKQRCVLTGICRPLRGEERPMPVSTQRRFDVDTMLFGRQQRSFNVATMCQHHAKNHRDISSGLENTRRGHNVPNGPSPEHPLKILS